MNPDRSWSFDAVYRAVETAKELRQGGDQGRKRYDALNEKNEHKDGLRFNLSAVAENRERAQERSAISGRPIGSAPAKRALFAQADSWADEAGAAARRQLVKTISQEIRVELKAIQERFLSALCGDRMSQREVNKSMNREREDRLWEYFDKIDSNQFEAPIDVGEGLYKNS
jgi:hypothetical protein